MTKHFTLTCCLALVLFATQVQAGTHSPFQFAPGITQKDYLRNTLIIKVKPAYRAQCTTNEIEVQSLKTVFASINITKLFKVFPTHQPPIETHDRFGRAYADLSLIYQVEYNSDAEMPKIINSLMNTDQLEYAEPKYIPTSQYTPNDPSIASQQFLTRINAYMGWDVSKGDTNVVIGITDTGSDLDHPDLVANLKLNYADPINGVDDDADGYIDNYTGWDLGENDNDPTVNGNSHGSHVSGCAAAVTDNGVGVAGAGFYSRFLPVKIANASGALSQAYEGITYAADHGCSIINCSWGGGGGGLFGQNVIDYATINKNSLVVVAAGNNNSRDYFYPAAYNYALSIAATNSGNDGKASFSNHGNYVDVCAPGNNILSTIYDNSYQSESGTSMASPIAAGCAAIIKSYFPNYNALQVGEQLRVTADNIYGVNGNSTWQPLRELGTGRINLLNALTLTSSSVRMHPIKLVDNNDDVFIANDTLRITGDFTNYLDPTTNLIATISAVSNSSAVNIIDNTTTLGAIGTMVTTNNNADPFLIVVNPSAAQNTSITFKVLLTDGVYTDYVMFDATVNVDYINITINDVFTTNTSKGRLCYNGITQTEGLGFDYNTLGTLTYEAGLMIGNAGNVSDNVRGNAGNDNDFVPVNTIQKNDPPVWSDFDTYGKFNDSQAPSSLNVQVNHRSLSWSVAPDSKYHIFEYTIANNSGSTLSSLYAGIFSDWDIQTFANNKADEVAASKMGYVWCTDVNGLYAGIKVLTTGAWNHYAVDNIAGGAGGIDVSGGFTSTHKYTALSTPRATAGLTGAGNDVIDIVSTGPFTLNAGDSVRVAFALIAGESLADIIASANAAQIKYDIVTGINDIASANGVEVTSVYPNPVSNIAGFDLTLSKSQQIEIKVFDLLGKEIAIIANGFEAAGKHHYSFDTDKWSSGMYVLHVSGNDAQLNTRFVVGE